MVKLWKVWVLQPSDPPTQVVGDLVWEIYGHLYNSEVKRK